ncbi:MAG TPA: roadblock/LC7 domain-containing protein [Candidatus Altiarchaeales archaeon]|nr:roadblock/LC7 domain-containing protein [Candidatus Altiarchaeales archaeon]
MTNKLRKESIDRILREICNVEGIIGAIITDSEGNSISSSFPPSYNLSIYEAISSTLFESSRRILNYTRQGDIISILLEADGGKVLVSNASNMALLIVTEKECKSRSS